MFRTRRNVLDDLGLTPRQLEYLIETRPDLRPPLQSGRYVWDEKAFAKLREAVRERAAAKAAKV